MNYTVKINYCTCHPETCCCNKWVVIDTNGEKHSTYFHKNTAQEVAEALNMLHTREKELTNV